MSYFTIQFACSSQSFFFQCSRQVEEIFIAPVYPAKTVKSSTHASCTRTTYPCMGMGCVTIFVGRLGKGGSGLRAYASGVKVCGKSIVIRGSVRPMRSLVITRARQLARARKPEERLCHAPAWGERERERNNERRKATRKESRPRLL